MTDDKQARLMDANRAPETTPSEHATKLLELTKGSADKSDILLHNLAKSHKDLERRLEVCREALKSVATLKTKQLLGDGEMTYEDGSHNAFCQSAEIAAEALSKLQD